MHDVLKFRLSGYFFTLFLFVLFASILITPVSAETVVSISPSEQSIAAGSNVTVVVYFEPDIPISGAQFDISFNSDALSVVSISEGDVFTNNASTLFNKGTIDNSEGTITNVYNVLFGKNEVSESGTLATIVFDTKGEFSSFSSLELTNVVVSNSTGVAVPISVVNGMVTIMGAPAPSGGEISNTGSGRGGSSGATGEEFGNIEFKDIAEKNVRSGQVISYGFDSPENPVVTVNFTGQKNSGTISTTIEVLKNTSAMVQDAPNGLVYKNVNIWVGNAGFATPENIDSPTIGFRVNSSWMEMHGVDSSDIRLNRYSGNSWSSFETKVTEEGGEYFYFESLTPGFSPFAITAEGFEPEFIGEAGSNRPSNTQDDLPDEKALAQNTLVISILSIFVLATRRSRIN
ncbi:PGF-pre-PGF domain-containing protein [Methanococcoides alaskense]|uniref:PGF-pre-PGF domain-containing protein n=1 Tax=Methanococcoides alaskense TaxID=325778 RepID=A0AA90Z7H7_9EURY|nr:PGF-pre-PGF domain-containing protein [Methanococcoides alaskense]MDR6222635.1 PGF-pre-PGF domain-containing protein [Methanococcoides alaskense]